MRFQVYRPELGSPSLNAQLEILMVSPTPQGENNGALVVWPETLSQTPWLINKSAGGPPFAEWSTSEAIHPIQQTATGGIQDQAFKVEVQDYAGLDGRTQGSVEDRGI